MKANKYTTVFLFLNALTLSASHLLAEAAQGKKTSNRGGQASAHLSAKAMENSNAQWSADPDRGWVRAGERHELHSQSQSKIKDKPKQTLGKHKGNGVR